MNKKRRWWRPQANFFIHAAMGTLVFLIIGIPAVALSLLVHRLESFKVPTFTVSVLTFLEHSILVIDAMTVLIYVTVSTCTELKFMIGTQMGEH